MGKEKLVHTPEDAEDFEAYRKKPDKGYADKGGHQRRSEANDTRKSGGHSKHK